MEKEVIKVLKSNSQRRSREEKNVIIYELKEKVIPMRIKIEKEETKSIKAITKTNK